MTLLWVILGIWLGLSALATAAWCCLSWFYGTRDCNRPALRAAQHAHDQARRDFVTAHMRR